MGKAMSSTKVYYNSACPVCAAGIRRQRARLHSCGEALEWIDVHADNDAVSDVGASLEFVRERLHVVDGDGNLHLGADAIAELLAMTPGQRPVARLARLPVVRHFLRAAYNAFAVALYRWNRRVGRW